MTRHGARTIALRSLVTASAAAAAFALAGGGKKELLFLKLRAAPRA